jgi:hypothetical protein
MQTIRVVAIQCCTIGVNLSWYSRPHEAWRGLGSLVPYCTYSQFKLVIASDLSWKNWTFGIQRQVVCVEEKGQSRVHGVLPCDFPVVRHWSLRLVPGRGIKLWVLLGRFRVSLAWQGVRPRVGRVGPLRSNWPLSSLYFHNHDTLRRSSSCPCAASKCHCGAPLHGRQYMSVYDLARSCSLPLYRCVLTRGLLLAGPLYVSDAQFQCTPIPESPYIDLH